MTTKLSSFTDVLGDADEICDSQISQPLSLSSSVELHSNTQIIQKCYETNNTMRPAKGTGQHNDLRSVEEIDSKYRNVFTYPYFNLIQSKVIEGALYSDKSMVVCAPTGSGKTVIFEMTVVQLLMELEDKKCTEDYKIIYMAPVKALCTERLTEWYSKFTKLGLMCIEVTGDTDVDFKQLQAYKVIITTPEKWDMLTRRWRDHRGLVEMIKLFLIDEVHILNDETRGPVLEAVVSRMKTIQASAQSAHRIEKLQKQYKNLNENGVLDLDSVEDSPPRIRFVAVSATVSNPEDVAAWLGTDEKPAVYYKFGDECRPVRLRRVVEGYPCADGASIFKFDIVLNYKLWPIIQKYYDGKPTLIFCNTRKSVLLTAETLSREITITFSPEQQVKLTALASMIKNKKLQSLVLGGVGCHHAGMLYEERTYIEQAFRNGDLPILITTTTLAMGVNLPAHLVIIKNTLQYVNGAYQEYSISTVLQMVGRAGRPQFDTEATAVIMTRQKDKARYQALAGGSEPLQSYLHKRLAENLNSETALGTVNDVAQCVEWLRSTFLYVRAAKDPKRYLGLTASAPEHLILKKIEELCVIAMNGLRSAGLITMDEASCIASTEAGRLMSLYYLDLETMKHIMKIQGNESLDRLLWIICESHELADMHLRTDERRTLNALNRNSNSPTIRFPMKGKVTTRQMKLNCVIQAILGCLPIPDPSLNQEGMKIMRIADRICKCIVAYVTRPEPISQQLQYYAAVLNAILLTKCIIAHLWENSPFVSKQLKGIGPTFSTLLATAGKINFMLLAESHPRDLERIMNKGPPAGNLLRKQISLLPIYQLSATTVDECTVSVKLLLLNQAFLEENVDHLTAGSNHKSYVVVGNSENHILMLRTFTEKDLMSIYDGSMNYEITRKHNFEHKIFVHCISSTFVGIDAQCEYTFKSLIPTPRQPGTITTYFAEGDSNNKRGKVASNVKDTTTSRKRKGDNENIAQSKEKKKRDSALSEKIKLLKESFQRTSNSLKKDLQKTQNKSMNMVNDCAQYKSHRHEDVLEMDNEENFSENPSQMGAVVQLNDHPSFSDDFIDDAKIDSILNEIETEITKTNMTKSSPQKIGNKEITETNNFTKDIGSCRPIYQCVTGKTRNKFVKPRSNYKFLELLEKNIDISDDDETVLREGGFSETIKSQIGKYISDSHKTSNSSDLTINHLLENNHSPVQIIINDDKDIHDDLISTNEHVQQMDLLKDCDMEKCIIIDDNKNQDNIKSTKENQVPNLQINETSQTISAQKYEESCVNQNNTIHADLKSSDSLREENTSTENTNTCNQFVPNDDQQQQMLNKTNTRNDNIPNRNRKIHENREFKNSDCLIHEELPVVTFNKSKELPKQESPTVFINETFPTKSADLSLLSSNRAIIPPKLQYLKPLTIPNKVTTLQTLYASRDTPLLPLHISQKSSFLATGRFSQGLIEPLPLLVNEPTSTNLKVNDATINCNEDNLSSREDQQKIDQIRTTLEVPRTRINCIGKEQSSNHFTSPEQGKTENSSQDLHSGNMQYEEAYSFSTEKVDIHTKFTDDHKIRIIRRLKVDLDIRKIVSNYDNKNNIAKNNTQNENLGIVVDKKSYEYLDSDKLNREDSIVKKLPVINECNKIIKSSNPEHVKFNEGDVELDENNTKSILVVKGGKATCDSDRELMNEGKNPDNENNVANILRKYSKLIGKNKMNESKMSTTQSLSRQPTTPKPIKSNRPFKISDMQHLHLPLPPILTETNKTNSDNLVTPTVLHPPVSTSLDKLTTFTNNINPSKSYSPKVDTDDFKQNSQQTPCHSPRALPERMLQISEDDFKIDQSMFNPKTLLQCIRNDDNEIIPPPPEYDDICYSYSPQNNNNVTTELLDFDKKQSPNYEERIHEKSVFDENFQYGLDLTPCKEIETWMLTADDDYESSLSTPLQSCTISKGFQDNLHSNFTELNTTNIKPKPGRLSAFRFNSKSKLKM